MTSTNLPFTVLLALTFVQCSNPVDADKAPADWVALTARINGLTQIVLVDYNDRSEYQIITKNDHYNHTPNFSPDKNFLIYQDPTTGASHDDQLVLYDVRSKKITPLFLLPDHPLVGGRVVWKPDGTGIYYRVVDFFLHDIFCFDFSSGNREKLTNTSDRAEWPVGFKGPDTLIVVSNDTATTRQPWGFYFMDLKGNYLSRIDNPHLDLINRDGINLKAVYNPDWSDEKGMFVCAASDSDHAGYRIAITNLDGSFYRIYTDGDFIDDNPAWGPEGQKVLFARSAITDYNRFGARIMILDINTGQIDNLVETSSIGGATASLEPDY